MKHAENCPSFDFEYEVGSGMEIPNCTCGAETDYGVITHPMEGLREDDYAALRAERDALSQYLIEYVKIAERKNNIGRLLFFEQQMLIRAKKALSVGKHIADNTASIKSERDALVEALNAAKSVLSSINSGKFHAVKRNDGEVVFVQTGEWCEWAKKEVLPMVEKALKLAGAE